MQYRCNLNVAGKDILTYCDILHSHSVLFFFFWQLFIHLANVFRDTTIYLQDPGATLLNRKDIVLALTEFIIG